MVAFDESDFTESPVVIVEIKSLVHDDNDCVAVERVLHRPDLGGSSDPGIEVLEFERGAWLISFVGSGWTCDGPHPFGS
jgi:hypothetical protein